MEIVKEGADGRRANVHAFTTTDIGALLRSFELALNNVGSRKDWPIMSCQNRQDCQR